jgi:mannose-1-phosphate guanylyltransferase
MQALVLVGGEGTRMRPLTLTRPKPALPLVDRPFIRYIVDWLSRHRVAEVVMACGFGADPLREVLGEGDGQGPRIRYVEEREPLGTAGPLRLAADEGLLGDRFLVLNGDLLSDLALSALIRGHEERGAVATLALSPVEDSSTYGLVRRAGGPTAPGASPATAEGEVLEFLEKPDPGEIDTDEVSTGAYVLERSVVEAIPPGRMVSIEHEVFPRLVGQGLYGHRLEGYWMDIGTPERYLQATWDILEGRVETEVEPSPEAVMVAGEASVAETAVVGPRAVVADGCRVGERATVRGSVLLEGCTIGDGAEVLDSILGPGVEVEEGVTLRDAVVGEGERVKT